MVGTQSYNTHPGHLLSLSARLNRAETVPAAVKHTIELAETVFDQPIITVCERDRKNNTVTTIGASTDSTRADSSPDRIPESVLKTLGEREDDPRGDDTPEATVNTDCRDPFQSEIFVPVGSSRVLCFGITDRNEIDETGVTVIEEIAANLETALARIDRGQAESQGPGETAEGDATALHRLNEITVEAEEFDATIDKLLSLGCDHLGLDTAILSHVEGDDYTVEAVVNATGIHEAGAVYNLGETMCDATLAGEAAELLAFADVADTDHRSHPAAENVRAYIGVPVVVDGETYGTVNFSKGTPRSAAFSPEDEEYVKHIAQWIGTEIERRRRFEELKRYETIIEAVDDPVYALDADGRFTFLNQAASREFGYGAEMIGERPSVGMDNLDVERIREQIERLLTTGEHSTTAEFELETADGGRKIVENRLGLIDDDEFRGTAGVLRDITARKNRQQQLESFQRAIESSRDGVAVLDGHEYTYVDQSHVDIYGFEDKEQLVGNTWRKLYDDEEIKRLEAEAFPALEADGYWRGMVTGTRPDGSTFPAELSLTIVDDGRLVCTVRDETERVEREQQTRERKEFLQRIYEVTTNPELTFDEKITKLLKAGRNHLDLPYGFLTRIETGNKGESGVQTIVEALGSHELLQPGRSAPLEQSYCRKTIEQGGLMTLTHAAEEGWADDVAYETFGLETYIGGEVVAGDDLYGTLCFASKEPGDHSFDEFERSFIRLVARWVGYEINRRDTREELREQRERLELALSGTNTGLAEWDLETDAVMWNETLTRIVGRDVDGIEEFRAAVHPDDRDRIQAELKTMLETGDPWTGEFRMLDADGDTLWLGTRATPVYNDGGESVRVLATGTDISGRKEVERRQRRNERRFESLFDDPGMLVGLLDTDGTLLDANETAMEYVDATSEELRGEPFCETPWWNHSEELMADMRGWIERAADGEYVDYEATHPDSDGNQRHITGTVRPVTDESGTVRSLFVTGRDVTERERQQRELIDRQQKLDLVLSNTDTSVVELDLGRGTVHWDDVVGDNDIGSPETFESFMNAVHVEDRKRLQSDLEAMVDTGEPLDDEYRIINEDGETVWVAAQAAVEDGDRQASSAEKIIAIATDVTDFKEREQALLYERERFRLLVESVDEYAFLVVGEDGAIQTWNDSAETLFGYDADTALGMSMAELHPEADRGSGLPERLLQQARIAGESAHEGPRVRADGSEFYADVRHAPLETDDGEFRGYAKIVRDMTDRRRERRRTERFVEQSEDVVSILDPDGTITYTSGSAERVLGYDPDDLVGENLFDYIHPDGREHALETFYECVDGKEDVVAECRLGSPDGGWLNIEGQCRNMLDDEAVDGILVYIRDVTESKERARRFESIFNQTFQFTGLLEPDGTVIEANDAALEFGGVESGEIVGNAFYEAPWWTYSEDAYETVRDAIDRAADGEFVRYETEVRGADGLATIDFSVKPVTDEDGDVSLLVAEGRDITNQQQHRRNVEVMQRVMRHNLRNDLTKVEGWAQLMCEEADAEKRAEQYEVIDEVLDKWRSMTEKMKQIRTALRSQRDNKLKREPESLIDDAVAPIREELPDATVVTDVSDARSTQVPAALQDAVRELVENAAESRDNATIEVELTHTDAGWIELGVTDDGPGMPDIEADVLETGEESPLSHGEGLGLWMVRSIVTQAGGDVGVKSTTDGTEVCLRVPTGRVVESGLPAETPG